MKEDDNFEVLTIVCEGDIKRLCRADGAVINCINFRILFCIFQPFVFLLIVFFSVCVNYLPWMLPNCVYFALILGP